MGEEVLCLRRSVHRSPPHRKSESVVGGAVCADCEPEFESGVMCENELFMLMLRVIKLQLHQPTWLMVIILCILMKEN